MGNEEFLKAKRITRDRIPKLYREELRYISGMARRTDALVRESFFDLDTTRKPADVFQIVTIPLDIQKSELHLRNYKVRGVEYKLHHLSPSSFARVSASILENVKTACEWGAQFICACELGYPSCREKSLEGALNDFNQSIQTLSNESGSYIIPGTYHCSKTLHNMALLFSPENEGNKSPRFHAKKTSAESVGEIIRIPYSRDVRFYNTRYCPIGILICLDSYDPSLIIGLVRANHHKGFGKRGVDIIFVPSFNPDIDRATDACRELSYILANVVVFVNAGRYGGGQEDSVFMCGQPVPSTRRSGTLRLYEIKVGDYEAAQQYLTSHRTQLFREAFGLQDVAIRPF